MGRTITVETAQREKGNKCLCSSQGIRAATMRHTDPAKTRLPPTSSRSADRPPFQTKPTIAAPSRRYVTPIPMKASLQGTPTESQAPATSRARNSKARFKPTMTKFQARIMAQYRGVLSLPIVASVTPFRKLVPGPWRHNEACSIGGGSGGCAVLHQSEFDETGVLGK